jgi:hypothetical protein
VVCDSVTIFFLGGGGIGIHYLGQSREKDDYASETWFFPVFFWGGGVCVAKCINNELLRTVCSFRMESIIEVPERSPPLGVSVSK